MSKETGGAAFPRPMVSSSIGVRFEQDGITLRDYFAAKAMQGYVSGERWLSCSDMHLAAQLSYKLADEMLRTRDESL